MNEVGRRRRTREGEHGGGEEKKKENFQYSSQISALYLQHTYKYIGYSSCVNKLYQKKSSSIINFKINDSKTPRFYSVKEEAPDSSPLNVFLSIKSSPSHKKIPSLLRLYSVKKKIEKKKSLSLLPIN